MEKHALAFAGKTGERHGRDARLVESTNAPRGGVPLDNLRGASDRRGRPDIAEAAVLPMAGTEFSDFEAGRHHAMNVSTMLREADAALLPQSVWMPISLFTSGR